jgi:hypothetical protein
MSLLGYTYAKQTSTQQDVIALTSLLCWFLQRTFAQVFCAGNLFCCLLRLPWRLRSVLHAALFTTTFFTAAAAALITAATTTPAQWLLLGW